MDAEMMILEEGKKKQGTSFTRRFSVTTSKRSALSWALAFILLKINTSFWHLMCVHFESFIGLLCIIVLDIISLALDLF